MCWTNLRLKKKLKNMKSEVKYIDADTKVTSLLPIKVTIPTICLNKPMEIQILKLAIFYQ